MPSLHRLISCGLSKGIATVLALLLSAVGGLRVGFDRMVCGNSDYRPAAVCAATPRDVATPADAVCASAARPVPLARPEVVLALGGSRSGGDHLPAPSLLLGSAHGPRAP
jgi:hypothetical protein